LSIRRFAYSLGAVRLLRLRQSHFRNLKSPEFAPPPGLTTVVGGNAQGKSNLLEAIYLALGGELKNGLSDRIAFGETEAWVYAEVETQFGPSRLENKLSMPRPGAAGGRELWLNEGSASLREFAQLPGAVLLGPDDLELVIGPPEERRRFLDLLLSRFSARYRSMLSAYARALQQRNALLKTGGKGLGVWNAELAKYGAEILSLRRRMLGKLAPLARESYRELAPGELHLELVETASPDEFLTALEDTVPQDLERGVTSIGPHRDDLAIRLDQRDALRFASRGEARSIALALRLGEHRLLWQHYDEAPLLLVDEWHSELDPRRRQALLGYAESLPQAILAGLEAPQNGGTVFWIEAGVWG